MPVNKASRGGLKADVEGLGHDLYNFNVRLFRQTWRGQTGWREQFDRELIGLRFLFFVLPRGSLLSHVKPIADEPAIKPEFVPLKEKMAEFMAYPKARRLSAATAVDQNAPPTTRPIRQQDTFASVQRLLSDLIDPEGQGDILDGDGVIKLSKLLVDRTGQRFGIMDVRKINAVQILHSQTLSSDFVRMDCTMLSMMRKSRSDSP